MAREGIDLYGSINLDNIENIGEFIKKLREDFDSHIHDGTSSKLFQTLRAETLFAQSSKIGGFRTGQNFIRDEANSFGLSSVVSSQDDVRFWAGSTFANRATASFRVYESGALFSLSSNVKAHTIFETTARFTKTLVGSGAATFNTSGVLLDPGATNPSSVNLEWKVSNNYHLLNSLFSVIIEATGVATGSGTGILFVGIGSVTVAGAGLTMTDRHIGFKIVKSGGSLLLSATQADGTTENVINLPTVQQGDIIELVFKTNGSSGKTDFYYRINGGELRTTQLITNYPNASTFLQFAVSNQATAYAFGWTMMAASYER